MLPRRHWLTILILLVGTLASLLAAWQLANADQERSEARFHSLAQSAVTAVDNKMDMQIALLRGAAGLFNASGTVSQEQFRAYVDRLRLERNHPGVLGIGFAAFAPTQVGIQSAAKASSAQGLDVAWWPAGERDNYSAILRLEPLNRRNRAALGFDMMSEPTRREAMVRAGRNMRSAMSGKVLLVQEIDKQKQPGFLIYTPLARKSQDGGFRGWVYSPLRGFDLFGSLFSGRDFEAVEIAVFDGEPSPENVLYGSPALRENPRHQMFAPLEVAGRTLTLRIATSPQYDTSAPLALSIVVAAAGLLITILFAGLVAQRERTMGRIERQVDERTRQLRDANRQVRSEAEARSAAEAQLHQIQKMESIGQLTGGIAHDFNNMLAVVIGNLDLAQRTPDDPKRVQRLIEHARRGAKRAAELTHRLLAFARRQTLIPTYVHAGVLIEDMLEMVRRSIGTSVVLQTDLAADLWTIHVDAAQLESAVLNLAVNARDAMPDGGTLDIRTSNAVREPTGEPDAASGEFVMICVTDSGEGMSEEVRRRAFEPFFTTKGVGQGTGLGLSQVYGFAQQSGGFMEIQSAEGKGTTVSIALPRNLGVVEQESSAVAASGVSTAGRGETILLVEDEEEVRTFSADALKQLGYCVVEAASAAEALERLGDGPIDLLFTDVVMPGMDGRKLAEVAQKRQPGLRFLLTTGYSDEALAEHGGLPDGASLLHKPFSVEALATKVRALLDSNSSASKA